MADHSLAERLLEHAHSVNGDITDLDSALQAYQVAATGRRLTDVEIASYKAQIESGHLPETIAQFLDEMPQ